MLTCDFKNIDDENQSRNKKIVLLYKSKKKIWMFYGKFADEGENPVDNQNRYNA